MQRNLLWLSLSVVCFSFFSCNKQSEDSVISAPPQVWGKMSAIMEQRKIISGTDTITERFETAIAELLADPDMPGVFTDAGTVTLNGIELQKGSDNRYLKKIGTADAGAHFNLSDSVRWFMGGNNFVPSVSFFDTPEFPVYKGTFPSAVNRSMGLQLVLDTTTVAGADSVRVLIDDGGNHTVQKTFAAQLGVAEFSPSELAPLNAVNDQTAVMAILPYKGSTKVVRNKVYFFAKEKRLYQSVTIN